MTDPDPVVGRLIDAGATVATAESITGGRLGARLTDGAGASAAFLGASSPMPPRSKISVLGVPEALVDDHGVISEECARSMAESVRTMMGTTYGVSTTGVAGPDTQEDQPVGTVFVGVAGPDGTDVLRLALDGDRMEIQKQTVAEAMSALMGMMDAVERSSAGRRTGTSGPRVALGPQIGSGRMRKEIGMALFRRMLGDVLRERRSELGLTLREVSGVARVSLGYISEIERGQKEASSELLASLCDALEVPLSQVLRNVADAVAVEEHAVAPTPIGSLPQPDQVVASAA